MIMAVTYGINILPANDPFIRAAEASLEGVEKATVPGHFLADTIPAMKYIPEWMPGAGWKRKVSNWRKHTDDVFDKPFVAMKAAMVRNNLAAVLFAIYHVLIVFY